ncbi:DUF3927 family protein, partial [Escherichia coli]|nr:DUF3927 family protein [Escherichia coli]EHS3205351.1 DUF3927 family protein [Escherichia coli]
FYRTADGVLVAMVMVILWPLLHKYE